MDSYLRNIEAIQDIYNNDAKTFLHLYSNPNTNVSDIEKLLHDLVKNKLYRGINFRISSFQISVDKYDDVFIDKDGNESLINPIVKMDDGLNVKDLFLSTLKDFSVPSELGLFVSGISHPFANYKYLTLFPHNLYKFQYMIIYHGWGLFKSTKYPFESVFDKYKYSIEHEDDSIYVVRKLNYAKEK
jgi:hypothetical protein